MKPFYFSTLMLFILFFSQKTEAQSSGRFGVTLGATNYITDTNFLSSKSSIGYTAGVTGSVIFSDKFELFMEINYNHHNVKFIGRETETSDPEDIKFDLENIGVSAIINYNFLELEDFRFGVNLGPTATFYYGYDTEDSKAGYLLDPLQVNAYDMNFDNRSDEISFNAFVSIGLSAEYNRFMCNLRYYKGLTNPYRSAPFYSSVIDIEGKDSYFAFTVTYFILD